MNRDGVFPSKSLISIPPCENLIHKLLTCFLFFVISTIQNQWSFTVRKGNKVWQSRHSERCRGPQNEQSARIRLWFSPVLPLVSIPWINGSRSSRRTGTLAMLICWEPTAGSWCYVSPSCNPPAHGTKSRCAGSRWKWAEKNTPILDIQSLFLWCLLVLIFLWAFWDEPSEEPRFSEALSQHAAPPKVTKIARLSLKLALSFVDRPASGFATGQNGGAWSCQHQKVDLWHPEDCYNDYISHLRPSPTFRKLVQLQKPLGPLGCSFLLERRIFARPLNPTWTDKTGTRKNF